MAVMARLWCAMQRDPVGMLRFLVAPLLCVQCITQRGETIPFLLGVQRFCGRSVGLKGLVATCTIVLQLHTDKDTQVYSEAATSSQSGSVKLSCVGLSPLQSGRRQSGTGLLRQVRRPTCVHPLHSRLCGAVTPTHALVRSDRRRHREVENSCPRRSMLIST